MDTGDYTQWTSGGPGAGELLNGGGGFLSLEYGQKHSGCCSVHATVSSPSPPSGGKASFARLMRKRVPQDALFNVWMYIPERLAISKFLNLFEFQGEFDPVGRPDYWRPVWSLNLEQEVTDAGPQGEMRWNVLDQVARAEYWPPTLMAAPVGRWFRIQAFVHQATDETGRLTFWIDGELVADIKDVATQPTAGLLWAVGPSVQWIEKSPADFYFDDASIAILP